MKYTFKPSMMLAVGLLSCALFTERVQAGFIDGEIQFVGSASASTVAGTTTISFVNPWHVFVGDGDYSSVPSIISSGPPGQAATFNSVKYTGTGAGATLTASVIPQWTFTISGITYDFDLTDLSDGTAAAGSMSLSGTGTAHITGFDPTSASWSLQGSGSSFTFRFSSSTTAAIPDGGTCVAMLGFALVGVEGLRRKLRK